MSGQVLDSGSDLLPEAVAWSRMLLSSDSCNAIKKVNLL